MDDATWLAAELDATPTACQAAIDHKSGEADRRGRPWHNRRRMIRDVIPLDEWRDLVSQLEQKSKPKPKPVISGECGDPNHPAGKHVVETDQHRIVCWGPAA